MSTDTDDADTLRSIILPLFKLLPSFNGDPEELKSFIKAVNAFRTLISPQMKQTSFELIKAKIIGPAQKLIKNKNFTEWEEIKKCLLTEYGPVEEEDSDEDETVTRNGPSPDSTQDNQKGKKISSKEDTSKSSRRSTKSSNHSTHEKDKSKKKSLKGEKIKIEGEALKQEVVKEVVEVGMQTEDLRCVRHRETQTITPKTKIFKEQQTQTDEVSAPIIEERKIEMIPAHKIKTEKICKQTDNVNDDPKKNEDEVLKKQQSNDKDSSVLKKCSDVENSSKAKEKSTKDNSLKEKSNSVDEQNSKTKVEKNSAVKSRGKDLKTEADLKSECKVKEEQRKSRNEHSNTRKQSTDDDKLKERSKSRTRSSEGKKSKSRTSSPVDKRKSNNQKDRKSGKFSPRPLLEVKTSNPYFDKNAHYRKTKPLESQYNSSLSGDRKTQKRSVSPSSSPTKWGKRSRGERREQIQKYCNYCQRKGHEYQECRVWLREIAVCLYCGERQHLETNCRKKALDSLASSQARVLNNSISPFLNQQQENSWTYPTDPFLAGLNSINLQF